MSDNKYCVRLVAKSILFNRKPRLQFVSQPLVEKVVRLIQLVIPVDLQLNSTPTMVSGIAWETTRQFSSLEIQFFSQVSFIRRNAIQPPI